MGIKRWANAVDPNDVDPNDVDPNAVDPNAVDPSAKREGKIGMAWELCSHASNLWPLDPGLLGARSVEKSRQNLVSCLFYFFDQRLPLSIGNNVASLPKSP